VATRVRQACILVGGKGTRLGDVVRCTPKPLLGICDEMAFVDLIMEQLVCQGFDDIILLAGYLGYLIEQRYQGRSEGTVRIRVRVESEPRGTAGALRSAHDMIAPRFLLLNGDSFFDTNLRSLTNEAVSSDREALLALRWVTDASRYGVVDLVGNRIVRFREKEATNNRPAFINAGIYVLRSTVIDRIPISGVFSLEAGLLPRLAAEAKLFGVPRDGYFLDVGVPETLEQGRRELPAIRRKPTVFVDCNCVINVCRGLARGPNKFEWVPGAQEAVRLLNDIGYRVVMMSAQAGTSLVRPGDVSMEALHSSIQDDLATIGAFVDGFCDYPCHTEMTTRLIDDIGDDRMSHSSSISLVSDSRIDRCRSFVIWSKESNYEVARGIGLPTFRLSGDNFVEFLQNCLAVVKRGRERFPLTDAGA
jgi:UTP-glucose-1-phosphate uridylyltransferase/histidinol phosphatase-like enzyme